VAGERDPHVLAQLRHGAVSRQPSRDCHRPEWPVPPEHVFALKQALALYDCYKPSKCRTVTPTSEQHYARLDRPMTDTTPPPPLGPAPKPPRMPRTPRALTCAAACIGFSASTDRGPRLEASTAQTLLSEIGTDMSPWPTEKHFASWLGLAPTTTSRGARCCAATPQSAQPRRAGPALGRPGPGRTQTALGAYYRRRLGAPRAQGGGHRDRHKLARIVYHLLKHRDPYHPLSPEAYEHHLRQRELALLKRKAARLASLYSRGLPPAA